MPTAKNTTCREEYLSFIQNKDFPCIAAKTALTFQQLTCLVVDHLACPKDDAAILAFLYDFVDAYRQSERLYHSVAIIFQGPALPNEAAFEELFWQRLQALSNLDAQHYGYDQRVMVDPSSPEFSFSLKEEAFFVVGLHPGSSRLSRRFAYPTLVFNPHAQFEQIRANDRYHSIRDTIRIRDVAYSGSLNPMLQDYGHASEAYQYSGKAYDESWTCPFLSQHGAADYHSAA